VKSIFRRVLPSIAINPNRKVALGIAGMALAGAALTGAASSVASAHAAPTETTTTVAAASTPKAAVNQSAPKAEVPVAAKAAPANPKPGNPKPAAPAAAYTPSEKALGFDYQRQPNYYYCGPAATRIALSSVGQLNSFDGLAGELGTTESGTNSAVDIARVLNAHVGKGTYHAVSLPGQSASGPQMDKMRLDVVHAVTHGHSVVVNVIGSATDVNGNVKDYSGGHYLAVVGYGKGGTTVKVADSADPHGSGTYWMSTQNMANWAASRGYAA